MRGLRIKECGVQESGKPVVASSGDAFLFFPDRFLQSHTDSCLNIEACFEDISAELLNSGAHPVLGWPAAASDFRLPLALPFWRLAAAGVFSLSVVVSAATSICNAPNLRLSDRARFSNQGIWECMKGTATHLLCCIGGCNSRPLGIACGLQGTICEQCARLCASGSRHGICLCRTCSHPSLISCFVFDGF